MQMMMLNAAVIFGTIAAAYWSLREQSLHKGYGLTIHWWALVDFVAGVLICTLAMLGIFLVIWLLGGIHVEGVQFVGASVRDELLHGLWIAAFEEIISRILQLPGLHITLSLLAALLLMGRLGGTWPSRVDIVLDWCKWPALILMAVAFGFVHAENRGASPVSIFSNALGGMMYGIAFLGGRNVWLPFGMHFAWNFVQGPVLGFAVSGNDARSMVVQQQVGSELLTGGSFGPEASVVGIAFRFFVIAMVLAYLYRRAGRQGNLARLSFPIAVYDNPPGSARPIFGGSPAGAPNKA